MALVAEAQLLLRSPSPWEESTAKLMHSLEFIGIGEREHITMENHTTKGKDPGSAVDME